MSRRSRKMAIELASDIGVRAMDLHAYGDAAAVDALRYVSMVNPDIFAWLRERINESVPAREHRPLAVSDWIDDLANQAIDRWTQRVELPWSGALAEVLREALAQRTCQHCQHWHRDALDHHSGDCHAIETTWGDSRAVTGADFGCHDFTPRTAQP